MAYTNPLDPAVPDDGDNVSSGAEVIREFKAAMIERLETVFGDLDVDPLELNFVNLEVSGTSTLAGEVILGTATPRTSALTIGLPTGFDDSYIQIGGSYGSGNIGDNRALGIRTKIYPDPVTGARSSESINCQPSYVLPAAGAIASIEGYHIDFTSAPANAGVLWTPTACTIAFVAGFRVFGSTIPAGANAVYGLKIDAGLGGGAIDNFNIHSGGDTSRNFFAGTIECVSDGPYQFGDYAGASIPFGGRTTQVGMNICTVASASGAGTTGSRVFQVAGQANPSANANAYGAVFGPELVKAGSGTHSDFVGLQINAPTIIAGAANLTNSTTLKVMGAPASGTNPKSLWVFAGLTVLGPSVLGSVALDVGTTLAGAAMLVQVSNTTSDNTAIVGRLSGAVVGNGTVFLGDGNTSTYLESLVSQAGAGTAQFRALVSGVGDPCTVYEISGVQGWAVGIDNSDSDAFVIAASGTLGASNAIRISTAGAIRIPALAGVGSRAVVADASGNLTAP